MLLLDMIVNGQKQAGVARAEQQPNGVLLVATDAWKEARLAPTAHPLSLSDGTPAFPLGDVPGLKYLIDRRNLSLDIQAPASAFVGTQLDAANQTLPPPPRPDPGLMLNYDASASHSGNAGSTTSGATLEAVAFGGLGHFVTSGLVRDDGTERTATRLDSYWRYDMPHRMEALVVGDTVGAASGWSRPVRYGGLRWGSDFSLRPGFVTVPQLSVGGEAALPSTVDVLVNNVRRVRTPVQPGPFDLSNVPVVTGAGEINLVVRDLLGRETVIRQSYYASPRLLAPGLSDYSIEAGLMRSGYGETSEYGDAFAAGTWRRGLTPRLTGEARVELQADRRAAGVDVAGLLGTWAVGRAALAASQGSAQPGEEHGHQLQLGLERSTPVGGASFQYARATAGFAPFGEASGPEAPAQRMREQWFAGASARLWGPVSGGLSYVRQTRWSGETVSSLGLSVGAPLGRGVSMNLSANRRLESGGGWNVAMTLSMPLDDGVHGAASVRSQPGRPVEASASASHSAPAASGVGWRVEGSNEQSRRARGGLQYNAAHAQWVLDAAADAEGAVAARGGVRGTLGLVGGVAFASQPVGNGSVAVVQVGDIPGVPVKRSNQVVAHTDARGRAFVPGLLPWTATRIAIDPSDLPMDVEIAQTEQEVVPYARSGSVLRFEARRSRQALVTLHRPDGTPVPVGARVTTAPQGTEFLTGRRGEVWLTDLAPQGQRLQVSWSAGRCELDLPAPAAGSQNEIATLGPLTCGTAVP